jgi:hypothetical protein
MGLLYLLPLLVYCVIILLSALPSLTSIHISYFDVMYSFNLRIVKISEGLYRRCEGRYRLHQGLRCSENYSSICSPPPPPQR